MPIVRAHRQRSGPVSDRQPRAPVLSEVDRCRSSARRSGHRSCVSTVTLTLRMPIPSVRTIVWCSPPGMTVAWNAGPSSVPLSRGPVDDEAGRCLADELRLSGELDPHVGQVLEPGRELGSRLGRALRQVCSPVAPRSLRSSRNAVGKVLAVAGSGARRPSARHHWQILDRLPRPECRERGAEILRPLLEVVGHEWRRDRLDAPPVDAVPHVHRIGRIRRTDAHRHRDALTLLDRPVRRRCIRRRVPQLEPVVRELDHVSDPRQGLCLERQRHDGVGVLDAERKALEDGEDVAAILIHLSELGRRFGDDRDVHGIACQ